MKLSNTILKTILIITTLFAFLVFSITLIFKYKSFVDEKVYIKKEFLKNKKEDIKREITRVFSLIEYRQESYKNKAKKILINRTNQAYNIATSIYNENKNKRSTQEIKELIVSALKNISYGNKRTYFYINTLEGQAVLFKRLSKLNENKSLWNSKDVKGVYHVRNHIKIVKDQKEGFALNYFYKIDLDDNKQYPKISYVKLFKPFNWYIGLGEYLDDIKKQTKEDILKEIAAIRYGKSGYIFVNNFKKQALVYMGMKPKVPKDLSNNSNFDTQLKSIEKKDESYFFINARKISTSDKFSKMTYIKKYKKWQWIVGTGTYLDEVNIEIDRKEKLLIEEIKKELLVMFIILFITVIFIYFLSKRLFKYIDKNTNELLSSFKIASSNYKIIKSKKNTFKEFKLLKNNLNNILKSRNDAQLKLQNYITLVNENILISTISKKGIILDVSNAFCKTSKYKKNEIIGKKYSFLLNEDVNEDFILNIKEKLKSGKIWQGEIKNINKEGSVFWTDTIIQPEFRNEKVVSYTVILNDVTDKKNIEQLSITDDLTKLYNRRYFNIKIQEEIKRAQRANYYLSFLMLDIDYFKNYNDFYGHQAGDEALEKIAALLISKTNRASDFAFRLGGEEFGIIFSFENESASLNYAKSIKKEIEDLKIEHKKSKTSRYLTASIGLVLKKGSEILDSKELYKSADEALYKAKELGRNKVEIS